MRDVGELGECWLNCLVKTFSDAFACWMIRRGVQLVRTEEDAEMLDQI